MCNDFELQMKSAHGCKPENMTIFFAINRKARAKVLFCNISRTLSLLLQPALSLSLPQRCPVELSTQAEVLTLVRAL